MVRETPISSEVEFEYDSYLWILKFLRVLRKIFRMQIFYQVEYKYVRGEKLTLKLVDLLNENKIMFSGLVFSYPFDCTNDMKKLNDDLESFVKKWRKEMLNSLKESQNEKIKLISPLGNKLLMISGFLFSKINQKEVFEAVVADWQEEYFEALFKKEIWKARWINVRYTYAFLAAMWMKSPIGDLIQFVIKIAKQ